MCARVQQKGSLIIFILIMGTVFITVLVGFITYTVGQLERQTVRHQSEQAREIAEAGVNYYKWYLAHYPSDITHGTGEAGPYVFEYSEPGTGPIGEYSLDITSTAYCGEVSLIEITSTGATYDTPDETRTIEAKYARPTVAEYSYIINSSVWAGDDRTIVGPYHANGGIRMDGTNNSIVSSGQESWNCTSNFGCSPSQPAAPGVVGDGSGSDLWSYPTAPINFTGLTLDLATMQEKAETGGGVFIAQSNREGYRLVLNDDDTFDLYEVRRKENEPRGNAWGYHLNKIRNARYVGTYDIPASCPVIYVEDMVWLEGEVSSPVTIAAADVDSVGEDPSIILQDNIVYTSDDAALLAIAEYDVLVGFDVPNEMTVSGIFVAQTGRFGRNYYSEADLPGRWDEYVYRDSLTVNGSIVSNERPGTKWSCGGVYCSGFAERFNFYDRNLVDNPPPLIPTTGGDYRFIEWREMEEE